MRRPSVKCLAAVLATALGAGCAGTRDRSGVREYLEEATGTSVTWVATPATFVREQPGLAASGRDYVYLAPLAVSRGSEHSCWLWFGVWSTVDRQVRDETVPALKLGVLQIVADGEPMDLESRRVESRPAGLDHLPYATPVRPTEELMAQITPSQLGRLGRAKRLSLVDRPDGAAPRSWRGNDHAAAALGSAKTGSSICGY